MVAPLRKSFAGFQARAQTVNMVRADQVQDLLDRLLAKLQALQKNHMKAGRVSHAAGVRTAINALGAQLREVQMPACAPPAPPPQDCLISSSHPAATRMNTCAMLAPDAENIRQF
jgi:hypothetical protein